MNCGELAETWVERWPRESPQTQRQHRASVRAWGEENAGKPLASYTREEARSWALRHPSQVRYLRACFNDAMRDGLVSVNPFAALGISPPRRELVIPSEAEVQTLLRAAQEPLRGRLAFAAYTGLRLGETLAVRPVDFG